MLALAVMAAIASCRSGAGDIHEAIKDGDRARTAQLIQQGADVQATNSEGATPLINAVLNRRTEIARLLIENGADVNATSLVSPRLLAKVARLDDRQTRVRLTPLITAALMGNRRIIKALLEGGASVDATGEDGVTALHAAALGGHPAAAQLLLDYGAPLDATSRSGQMAVDLAESMDHPSVVEVLETAAGGPFSRPIDVGWHYAIAARTDLRPLGGVWRWGAVPVGIAVGLDGSVYWAQYRTDTIQRVDAQGRNAETVATISGPLGLAFDRTRDLLFYVADRTYPRSVGRLQRGSAPQGLVYGARVNRLFAIAVGGPAGRLYWTESINGRIRAADVDGKHLVTLVDDGISSVSDRPDAIALSSAGIAVDSRRNFIFWTDLLGGTIRRARLDGGEMQTILTPADGLDSPTALALDSANGKLYWADPGTETIRRANLDGTQPEIVAAAADGVLEPYGLAIDAERRLLYWTDVARNTISRILLDHKRVERFVDLDGGSEAMPQAPDNGSTCEAASARVRQAFLQRWVKLVRTCLIKVSATKATKRRADAAKISAETCADQFRWAHDTLPLRTTLAPDCDAEQLPLVLDSTLQLGAEIVAADLPRAAEWLRDVRPFVAALGPAGSPRLQEALAAIDDLLNRLRRLDPVPAQTQGWTLPATGQTTTYKAISRHADGDTSAEPVVDDGAIRAGAPLTYLDNGDRTITDVNTGLMWEKKCAACGDLHDFETVYSWQAQGGDMDVSAWLQAVNAENGSGFAGQGDWRLPTLNELMSIVDYERFNPAVSTAFDSALCGVGCDSPREQECSCTRLGPYWTTTPFPSAQGEEDEVTVVAFNLGLVWGMPKKDGAFVRAVRGPAPETRQRFVDNGDGTITDRLTRLMWEKKCACPDGLHDTDLRLHWSFDGKRATLWDWLNDINSESGHGFAGHRDWRIPNVKELATLLDPSRSDPSIDPTFAQEQCSDLRSPRCSCTEPRLYWTSTTFADFPANALAVSFAIGSVDDRRKTLPLPVRAVRGPVPGTEDVSLNLSSAVRPAR